MESEKEVKLEIPVAMKKAFKDKADYLSTHYENEIAGFIIGKIDSKGIVIEDMLIPYQEVTGGHISMEGKNLVKLRKEYKDKCKQIVGEFHSHTASMSAFWSGEDDSFITKFMEPRDVGIFIVSSKGEHKIRLEVRKPFFISVDNLDYEYEIDESKVAKEMQKEIKKKLTEPKVVSCGYGGSSGAVYDYDGYNYNDNYYNDYDKSNKLKAEIAKRVTYYNNTNMVEVEDLYGYFAEALANEFEEIKPEVIATSGIKCKVVFKFKNKTQATDTMKEIKEHLKLILKEESETFGAVPRVSSMYESY